MNLFKFSYSMHVSNCGILVDNVLVGSNHILTNVLNRYSTLGFVRHYGTWTIYHTAGSH